MHDNLNLLAARHASYILLFSTTSLVALPAVSHPHDIQFVPRIETGISQYTLEFTDAPVTDMISVSTTAQVLSPILRLGGTLAAGKFYLDGYYHKTAEGKDDLSFPSLGVSESNTGDREEFNFTLGYQPKPGFTIFAGYRESDTKASGNLGTDYSFKHEGFFVGGAYSLPISDSTSLTVNGAYADLDANLDQLFLGSIEADEEGPGDGFKVGVAMRTTLSDRWAAIFAADYLSYDYDMESNISDAGFAAEERDIQFRVGLSYAF